jgi:K+-transporting ATPase ATPase A chain
MSSNGILQILVFFGLILLVTKPVGLFMSRLFQGERTFLHPIFRPVGARLQAVRPARGPGTAMDAMPVAPGVQPVRLSVPYALMRLQNSSAQSSGFGAARSSDQSFKHRHELHDEHELAVVTASRR